MATNALIRPLDNPKAALATLLRHPPSTKTTRFFDYGKGGGGSREVEELSLFLYDDEEAAAAHAERSHRFAQEEEEEEENDDDDFRTCPRCCRFVRNRKVGHPCMTSGVRVFVAMTYTILTIALSLSLLI